MLGELFGVDHSSERIAQRSGKAGWLSVFITYSAPADPPVPILVPIVRCTIFTCRYRHSMNPSSKSTSRSAIDATVRFVRYLDQNLLHLRRRLERQRHVAPQLVLRHLVSRYLTTDISYVADRVDWIRDEGGTTRSFVYDSYGRLSQIKSNGSAPDGPQIVKTYAYTYSRTRRQWVGVPAIYAQLHCRNHLSAARWYPSQRGDIGCAETRHRS